MNAAQSAIKADQRRQRWQRRDQNWRIYFALGMVTGALIHAAME